MQKRIYAKSNKNKNISQSPSMFSLVHKLNNISRKIFFFFEFWGLKPTLLLNAKTAKVLICRKIFVFAQGMYILHFH